MYSEILHEGHFKRGGGYDGVCLPSRKYVWIL